MPTVTLDTGRLPKEMKKELIGRYTELTAEVTKVPAKFITVIINEIPDENIAVSGKTLEEIKAFSLSLRP